MTHPDPALESERAVILLADDDSTVRRLARETLMAAGFRMLDAIDGQEALKLFTADPPGLVILDVDMPILDGLSVCRALREEFRSDVPVLMTAEPEELDAVRDAFDAGATDFLSKPIDWPALPHRVRYALRAGQIRAELAESRQRARALLEAIPDGIYRLDRSGSIIETNGSTDPESGARAPNELRTIEDLFSAAVAPKIRAQLHAALSDEAPIRFEYEQPETGTRWEARLQPQADATVLAILRDVTDGGPGRVRYTPETRTSHVEGA